MAGKQISVTMRLRSSRFVKALQMVQNKVKMLGARMTAIGKQMMTAFGGAIMKAGAMTTAFLGIGSALAVIGQVRAFIKLGADLDHLKNQTGMLASSLLVLKTTFEDAGVDGGKVGMVMNKMQRAIVDASRGSIQYVRSLKAIGLESHQLLQMKPEDQFRAIVNGLKGQQNQALKTAAAMDLFGRAGGELMPLIDNPQAIDDAVKALGGLPDAMDRMSAVMERIDTILGRLKMKVFQFLAPLIEHFAVALQTIMEKVNALDLTKAGRQFAKLILTFVEIVKAGKLGDLLSDLIIAGILKGLAKLMPVLELFAKTFGKILVTALSSAIAGIANNLPKPMKMMMGLGAGKVNADDLAKGMHDAIDNLDFDGIAKGLDDGAKKPMERIKDLFDKFKVEQLNIVTDPIDEKKVNMDSAPKWMGLVADSFRKVGGGGRAIGGRPQDLQKAMVDEQKKGYALFKEQVLLQKQKLEIAKQQLEEARKNKQGEVVQAPAPQGA